MRVVAVGAVAVLCVLGARHSALRQPVWMSNRTVFTTLLRDAPMNYRSHYAYGGMLFDEGHYEEGVREWRKAIALMPGNLDLYVELSRRLVERHRCAEAAPLLGHVLRRVPTAAIARLYLIACDLRYGRFRDARRESEIGLRLGGSPMAFTRMKSLADSALIRADSVD
jgi:tetratricopeptide (TPR) repeat protein